MSLESRDTYRITVGSFDQAGDLTYTIIVRDRAGREAVSDRNSVTVNLCQTETGFLPDPHGYQFGNFIDLYVADLDDLVELFGSESVCRGQWLGVCLGKPVAYEWLGRMQWELLTGARCFGMSATSLRFFKRIDSPSRYQNGASQAFDLNLGTSKVRRYVSLYQLVQSYAPVSENFWGYPDLTDLVCEMHDELSAGRKPLLVLNPCAHAVVPYKLQQAGPSVWRLFVYDPNAPGKTDHYVEINTQSNRWAYSVPGMSCSGRGGVDHQDFLGFLDVAVVDDWPLKAPWENAQTELGSEAQGSAKVLLSGPGHLLITSSQGARIGYDGNHLMNEISGARVQVIYAGLGTPMEPVYVLPVTDTYTILLDGRTLTQTEAITVAQFGPGYALVVENVALAPNAQDRLTFASDGSQLQYQPTDAKEVGLTLAQDGTSNSDGFYLRDVDLGAGETVTVTNDAPGGRLALDNSHASGGRYNLEFVRLNSTQGERKFAHASIPIAATDTHYMQYGAWAGFDLTVLVDHGSDGSVDETLILDNETLSRVRLPLVLKTFDFIKEVSYWGSSEDCVYRIDASAFRGYTTESASDSSLRHVSSPPAPLGWNQPGFVPDSTWRPASPVWFWPWADTKWAGIPVGSTRIGLLDENGDPAGRSGETLLYRRTFDLTPPKPGMKIKRAVLEMWSDNKTEWWWQANSVAHDKEATIGEIELYPTQVSQDGGAYLLAVQDSNDYVCCPNPQGIAYRLQVTWGY